MENRSGGKKLDAILVEHGVQLQLLAYLNVLRNWTDPRGALGAARLIPAGVFYVNLRGQYESGGTRIEVLDDADGARKRAYRHTGRFDASVLPKLDRVGAADQFSYQRNKDGSLRKGSVEALPRAEFEKLSTGLRSNCAEWAVRFFPAWRRWTRIARAVKRRANFAITARRAGLINGRTVIACCAQRQRRFHHELSEPAARSWTAPVLWRFR